MRGLLVVCLLLLLAAPAAALPPDPPVAPLSPADGATLPVNADGIGVSFTCPPYTSSEGFPPFGPIAGLISDYGAGLSSVPTLGADGRLAQTAGIGSATETTPGTCVSTLGSGGFPKPQTTPGTWYWQAWRACSGCAGGWETSPVRSFTLSAAATITLIVPAKAYVGFPVVAAVTVQSASTASALTIERRTGASWRPVATVDPADGDAFITLPRGSQQLRATARFGTETMSSKTATLAVAKATQWQTAARDDGAYRDAQRPSVRFKITGGGRKLTGFHADVPTVCSSPTSSTGIAPGLSTVELPPVKVAPDGRFALAGTYRSIKVRFSGRLSNRRLTGARAAIRTSTCAGSIAVRARRR